MIILKCYYQEHHLEAVEEVSQVLVLDQVMTNYNNYLNPKTNSNGAVIGSGRKVPGTARLRTGIQPAGPGTQVILFCLHIYYHYDYYR